MFALLLSQTEKGIDNNEQLLEAVVEICRHRDHRLRFGEIGEKGIETRYAPGDLCLSRLTDQ